MKRTREQKGITLVALIITIIVLLILAVVTIAAVQDGGIIQYAQNARDEYGDKAAEENEVLQGYLDTLKENDPNGGGAENGDDNEEEIVMPQVAVGTKATENSTINGKGYSSTNPVIPKGFMPVNTSTSAWNAEGGPEVLKGLVISDGTSEFVWIPVKTLDNFARLQDDSTENYRGVLYNWYTR